MEIPRGKKILHYQRIRILVIAVIRPIGLPCPVLCEADVEAAIRLQKFGVERSRGRSEK